MKVLAARGGLRGGKGTLSMGFIGSPKNLYNIRRESYCRKKIATTAKELFLITGKKIGQSTCPVVK